MNYSWEYVFLMQYTRNCLSQGYQLIIKTQIIINYTVPHMFVYVLVFWPRGECISGSLVSSCQVTSGVPNILYCTLQDGVIFERNKQGTRQVMQNCYWTPIPKFHISMILFSFLCAGPLKMLTVTLKWARKQLNNNVLNLGQGGSYLTYLQV